MHYILYIVGIYYIYTYFGVEKLDVSLCQKKKNNNNKEKITKTIGKDHYYKNPPGWYNGWNNTIYCTRDERAE